MKSVLGNLDYISIHVPKQADGSAVIRSAEFALMKKGVRIANAARGGVIDEIDLIEALNNGTVAGIALDVYENEPNPKKNCSLILKLLARLILVLRQMKRKTELERN